MLISCDILPVYFYSDPAPFFFPSRTCVVSTNCLLLLIVFGFFCSFLRPKISFTSSYLDKYIFHMTHQAWFPVLVLMRVLKRDLRNILNEMNNRNNNMGKLMLQIHLRRYVMLYKSSMTWCGWSSCLRTVIIAQGRGCRHLNLKIWRKVYYECMMTDCVVLGVINFSRIQAGQQRILRFRGLLPHSSLLTPHHPHSHPLTLTPPESLRMHPQYHLPLLSLTPPTSHPHTPSPHPPHLPFIFTTFITLTSLFKLWILVQRKW